MITGQATEQLVALRVNRDGRRESLPPKSANSPQMARRKRAVWKFSPGR